jgi:hypothetical protein
MPTLAHAPERHVVIDRRPGHYLCFPDVCRTADGRLLTAYNEYDQHVGARRRLLLRESADQGRTWSAPRMLRADASHCPRFSQLSSDQLVLSDDSGPVLHWSADQGRHWAAAPIAGVTHGLLDRILELDTDSLAMAGHMHRGAFPHPKTRQPTTEQMLYRSADRGRTWRQHAVIAHDPCLVLCEASLVRLPEGRLLALMRENSFVYEPMYACVSEDGGDTWSEPQPTRLIGHRPTLGLTSGGRLLCTYRNVGPDSGTCAWLGSLEDLCGEFAVHGLAPDPGNPTLGEDGLLIRNDAGPQAPARYALRPLTDPERAVAELEAQVLCRAAQDKGCGLRLGVWWKIFPERIVADVPDAEPVALEPDRFHTLRLVYAGGKVALSVDGEVRQEIPVNPRAADARAIVFGTRSATEDNGGEHLWRRLKLRTVEPRYGRDYTWTWHAAWGLPDAWVRSHVLELANDRRAQYPDFGYSGWCELESGRFFGVFHHGGGEEQDYVPGRSSHVRGCWFETGDFGK